MDDAAFDANPFADGLMQANELAECAIAVLRCHGASADAYLSRQLLSASCEIEHDNWTAIASICRSAMVPFETPARATA